MATTEAPPKEKTKSKEPPKQVQYAVFKSFEGTPEEIVSALTDAMVPDEPQSVLLFVSQALGSQPNGPKKAIEAVAEHRDVVGDYAVTAVNSISTYKGLQSQMKRTIAGL